MCIFEINGDIKHICACSYLQPLKICVRLFKPLLTYFISDLEPENNSFVESINISEPVKKGLNYLAFSQQKFVPCLKCSDIKTSELVM